jgi:ribulose kinase
MSDLICVFDVGTTGTRTIIFDINGKEIVKTYEEYPVFEQPVGISEQNPEIWWNAIKNTCNRAIKKVKKKQPLKSGRRKQILEELYQKFNGSKRIDLKSLIKQLKSLIQILLFT